MADEAPSDDPEILEQLHEHELALERRLEVARQAARARERETAELVARLQAESQRALEHELARLRAEHARDVEAMTRRARDETERACGELRRSFVERRASAAEHVLALLGATEG